MKIQTNPDYSTLTAAAYRGSTKWRAAVRIAASLGVSLAAAGSLQAAGTTSAAAVPTAPSSNVGSQTVPICVTRHVSQMDRSLRHHDTVSKKITREANGQIPVVVQTLSPLTAAFEAQFKALGGTISNRFTVIQGFSGILPIANVQSLSNLTWVESVSSDMALKKLDDIGDVAVGSDVANTTLGTTGSNITVAVLDTGVRALPDLASSKNSRVIIGPNFTADPTSDDQCGHGTHIAGIIAGNGSRSTGQLFSRTFKGVAPMAQVLSVKVLDSTGQGSVSSALAGIQWCIQNKKAYNIRVMNLSIGHAVGESYTVDPLCRAVEQAWKAGIVVVVAAGNDGRSNPSDWNSPPAFGTIESPGNDPYVITVGATNSVGTPTVSDDVMSSYSSHGPTLGDKILKPDLVAPGNQMVSLEATGGTLINLTSANGVPANYYAHVNLTIPSLDYYRLSGTSMSAGVVSGAAALLLAKNPSLRPDTVKGRLMKTALKVWNPHQAYNPCYQGAGMLNIPAALNSTDVVTGWAISPTVIANNNGTFSLSNVSGTWGSSVLWSDSVMWADSTLAGESVLWSDSVMWADSVLWGDSSKAVDGDSVMWADVSLGSISGD